MSGPGGLCPARLVDSLSDIHCISTIVRVDHLLYVPKYYFNKSKHLYN